MSTLAERVHTHLGRRKGLVRPTSYRFTLVLDAPWQCPDGCLHQKGEVLHQSQAILMSDDAELHERLHVEADAWAALAILHYASLGATVVLQIGVYGSSAARDRH
jgi:hypothetical protein